ncbi:MAG: VOC family protein [Candidatus Latescibacterota bacterium]|jgi:catechol 2,3-dioxygenase-like lactoylglutathione lyase family enzyme
MNCRYAHTNIIAADWKRLAEFYETVFDCRSVPPRRNLSDEWLAEGTGIPNASLEGVHLRLPGHGESGPTLEIYSYTEMEPRSATAPNRLGYGHLAFEVEDVEAFRDAVLAHGGSDLGRTVEADVPGAGRLTFTYMADPEGNVIEIQNWT